MSHISLPSKSTLAASTIPAVMYLGYLMKTKYDQSNNSSNNSNNKSSINNNTSTSSFQQAFSSQLQQKLEKVQRSRLDPIAEEKEYWTH